MKGIHGGGSARQAASSFSQLPVPCPWARRLSWMVGLRTSRFLFIPPPSFGPFVILVVEKRSPCRLAPPPHSGGVVKRGAPAPVGVPPRPLRSHLQSLGCAFFFGGDAFVKPFTVYSVHQVYQKPHPRSCFHIQSIAYFSSPPPHQCQLIPIFSRGL